VWTAECAAALATIERSSNLDLVLEREPAIGHHDVVLGASVGQRPYP
jgi:hypothetical protein